MMTGMGLALGIDYSLFVISRFREERATRPDKEAAIRMDGATASRAVLFSGTTFVIALLGMFLVPTNILRSLAAGAVIVGIVSVAAALTLLPAMLSLFGDRINSLRIPVVGQHPRARADAGESPIWRAVIERVLRRRVVSLVGGRRSDAVLAASRCSACTSARAAWPPSPTACPPSRATWPSQRYFPDQDPYPVEIVAAGGGPADRADLTRLEGVLAADPRFGSGQIQTSADGKTAGPDRSHPGDAVSSRDVAAVRHLRQQLIPSAFAGSACQRLRRGARPQRPPTISAPSRHRPPTCCCFVLGLSFLLLLLAFRSLVVAAVSILLNLLSVGAAYGLLTLVFIHGVGASFFGFQRVTAIDAWVPLFLFSVLFALSMDYQVFLMSRIKERYDQTGSTRRSGHRRGRLDRQDHHRCRPHHRGGVLRIRPGPARSCSSRWASAWRSPCFSTPPSSVRSSCRPP